MIRFLRKSVGEIRHSVETYLTKTIIVPCQVCSNHVPIRVMGLFTEPDKPVEIKCKHCDHTVCFTTKRPLEHTGPTYSGPVYTGNIIYKEPLSLESLQQATSSHSNRGISSSFYDNPTADNDQSLSHTPLANSKRVPLMTSKLKQNIPKRKPSVSFSENLQTFYGGRNSTSNDSSSEYLEDQDSIIEQSYSHRSSISLPQKPSTSQPSILLGLEQCGEKTGGHSWNPPPWLHARSMSPPLSSPSLGSQHAPPFSDERALKKDGSVISPELEYLANRRGSGDSIDLTSGRVEMRAAGKSDQFQAQLFAMDLDSDKNPESAPASDSEPGSIRGGISDKRRGKMPMRPNAIHRAAVARRHSQKIELQEQHEAETLSAKRRNSLNSDFEVEPSDEEVRQAHKIYTASKNQHWPYQESDIQWARGILRTRKNWEKLRYEHPFGGSMEQLQLKPRNSAESVHPLGSIRHPLPFAISTPPNMSPRISRLSLHLPTPVKEEPEGDALAPVLLESFSNLSSPKSSDSVSRLPNSLETSGGGPNKTAFSATGLPPPATIGLPPTMADGSHGNDSGQPYINNANPPVALPKKSQNVNNRWRKALTSVTRRVSCFHEGAPQSASPLLVPLAPSSHNQQPCPNLPSLEADSAPPVDVLFQGQPRSSGEIMRIPTSEEPLVLVGQEISGLVGLMRSPLVQIQFEARPEDLFAR